MVSQTGGMDVNAIVMRLRRLAMLDTSVFDEVRTDAASTLPAILIVVVATLLSGLGGWLWWIFGGYSDAGTILSKSAVIGTIVSVVLWFVWLGIVYVMLGQVFRARVDAQELVRVMGFAAAPLALGLLMCIHKLDYGIGIAVLGILFGTTQIAVQSATDAPAGKALAANAAGFAVWVIVLNLLVTRDNILAPGVFIFAPVY
jgi:hypothetical protein